MFKFRDWCDQCGNCPRCHLPKDKFIEGWTVEIPPGYPWVEIGDDEESTMGKYEALPKHFDYDGRPCSMFEGFHLKHSGKSGYPVPKSVVGRTRIRYKGKWYSICTDYMDFLPQYENFSPTPGRHLFIPMVYETMVFGPGDWRMTLRYAARGQASRGHRQIAKDLRGGRIHSADRANEKAMEDFKRIFYGVYRGMLPREPIIKSRKYKYRKRR